MQLLTSENTILWNNQAPQLARFCRPLVMEYIHESEGVILDQKRNIENQIDKLQSIQVAIDVRRIRVRCSLFLTLVDGKVLTSLRAQNQCKVVLFVMQRLNYLTI